MERDSEELCSPPAVTKETIAALATPPGVGGICIIRVSGPLAHRVARSVCPDLPSAPQMRRAYKSRFHSAGEDAFIDEGLVLLFAAPLSFTGEDVLELHGHGGPAQSRSILEAVLDTGCRAAAPGEFSRRAVENGRLDLARAEGIAELVAAESEAGLRAARALLGGSLSARIEELMGEVERLLAELEATIDFPEESGELHRETWLRAAHEVQSRALALASTWKIGSRLRTGPRVVLVGPPNSGKSSLLNALLGFERVLVDSAPGTTRDLVEMRIEIASHVCCLVDGAGLREPEGGVEAAGIERLAEAARGADLVLGVFDGSAEPGEESRSALAFLREISLAGVEVLLVANKSDLGSAGLELLEGSARGQDWKLTSAKTGAGVEELGESVSTALFTAHGNEGGTVVTLERHHRGLIEASRALAEAASLVEHGATLDLPCEDLRDARAALGEIVGRGAIADTLLDEIFGRFCIGK